MCISDNFVRFKLKSQPEIADTGSFVGPDQDILRLKERYANKLSQPQNKNKYELDLNGKISLKYS